LIQGGLLLRERRGGRARKGMGPNSKARGREEGSGKWEGRG